MDLLDGYPVATGPSSIFRCLHEQCSRVVDQSVSEKNSALLGEIYVFACDLDSWKNVIAESPESALIEIAAREYMSAILNVCQGQYRNGFKGLRLVLELCLQGVYLSSNLVIRAEWLNGKQDTIWSSLIDENDGPLSSRFCGAFFPDLIDHVNQFRGLARTLYRELSECIHGNIPSHIPLPDKIEFSQDALNLWHTKAKTLRLIVIFVFSMRFLKYLSLNDKLILEASINQQLGHISAVRTVFEEIK